MQGEPVDPDVLRDTVCRVTELALRYVSIPPAQPVAGETAFSELNLDSLGIVGLISDLERDFAITFPAEWLTSEVFSSPMTVAQAIARLRPPGTSAR